MEALTETVRRGEDLSEGDISDATRQLLDESVSEAAKADFLAALSEKGETAAEITAFVNEFLGHAVTPPLDRAAIGKPLLDVCGTGGDRLNLFNVSTASIFPLAAAGVAVVKHGNRGITSKSGGADALEALGIRIDLEPGEFARCLSEVGAGFLFAPHYHPAFKAVVPVRKKLAERGQRSVFNILGPLLNPVRPDYQLIGVFDAGLGPVFADILARLERKRAWVVHGKAGDHGGMDELSTLGTTEIWESEGERRLHFTEDPEILFDRSDPPAASLEDLQGGDAAVNAAIIRGILAGEIKGAKRDLVVLNAAAGLVVAGKAEDLPRGLVEANRVIDDGLALDVLERWRSFA